MAHDLTTAVYTASKSITAQSSDIGGIHIKNDGSACYVLDKQNAGGVGTENYIMEYDLSGVLVGTARIAIIGA